MDRQNPLLAVDNEVITPEPVLFRRRPPLNSNERQRRWSIDRDEDEIEVPIDENSQSTVTEIINPLLRQDVIEINQTDELTTILANEEISNNTNIEQNENSTSIENIILSTTSIDINSTNITEINQEISNESTSDNLIPSKFY